MKRFPHAVLAVLAAANVWLVLPGWAVEDNTSTSPMVVTDTDARWFTRYAGTFDPEFQSNKGQRKLLRTWWGRLGWLPPSAPTCPTERQGWRSLHFPSPNQTESVEVDWGAEQTIDAVVLVAAPGGNGHGVPAGYGFPMRFHVELVREAEAEGEHYDQLADFIREDFPNPGALPVYLRAHGRKARAVRITATHLFQEGKRYIFALGEVMVLQGNRNLAVGAGGQGWSAGLQPAYSVRVDAKPTASRRSEMAPRSGAPALPGLKATHTAEAPPAWSILNLVDGHTVLGQPVGNQPSPTLGYLSQPVPVGPPDSATTTDEPRDRSAGLPPALGASEGRKPTPSRRSEAARSAPKWLQVDLGASLPIQEVRLFPAHPPELERRHLSPGYGFPRRFKIEISDDASFQQAETIVTFKESVFPNPGNNVVTFAAGGHLGRYVRLTALELWRDTNGPACLALAEMQVWSGGANVALRKPVSALDFASHEDPSQIGPGRWSPAALVDGYNSAAKIVEWPAWLEARSREREILQRLAALDARQAAIIRRYQLAAIGLVAGPSAVALVVLRALARRRRRQTERELEALRQRISQDLHDEIGSSLCSIALISREAMTYTGDDALAQRDLDEIQGIVRQTTDAMRAIVWLVKADAHGNRDLTPHLQEVAARLLRSLPHSFRVEPGALPGEIRVDRKRDLILMFSEALHNIVRHADASQVDIALARRNGSIVLTVEDNGRGFDAAASAPSGMGLANLRHRANRLGGGVQINSQPGQGTVLIISFPIHDKTTHARHA